MFDRSARWWRWWWCWCWWQLQGHTALSVCSLSQQQMAMCLPTYPLCHSPPPPTENQERPLSFAIQCLRLAANIAQFVVIIQDIEPHNVRRHHQFQNVDGYAKSGGGGVGSWERKAGRERKGGREVGRSVWQPYKVQPELLLHMNWARKAEQGKVTKSEEDKKQYVIYRVELSDCYR